MTQLTTVFASAGADTVINQNNRALAPAGLYGIRQSGTSGLVLGYFGGAFNGVDVSDGSVTLTASSTNYVVAHRTTGTVTSATNTTNWLNTTTYMQLYQLVAGASTFTIAGTSDRRQAFGGTGSSSITTDNDPTLAANSSVNVPTQQAVKSYVDNQLQGLSWKKAVRAATTTSGTLASSFENGDAIDGVTLATGDRILIKNQSTASENGIYTVNASGAPTRAVDADTGTELVNATVFVSEGTTLADTQWTQTTNAPITVGSTTIAFAQLSAGGGASWGGITGALSSQTDLQAALDLKQARSPSIQAVTSSATVTPTFSNDIVKITAQAAALTLANPTGTAIDCLGIAIRIKDNGTARAITFGSQYRALGVTLPASTVATKTLYLGIIWNGDDTKWDVVSVGQEA